MARHTSTSNFFFCSLCVDSLKKTIFLMQFHVCVLVIVYASVYKISIIIASFPGLPRNVRANSSVCVCVTGNA